MATKDNPWMTFDEVLADLGVARSTLNEWRNSGRGPSFTRLPNGKLLIRERAYLAWTEQLEVA
jgi:predicted site-specific integrase-resolvase